LDYEKNQADPREQKHSAERACSFLTQKQNKKRIAKVHCNALFLARV